MSNNTPSRYEEFESQYSSGLINTAVKAIRKELDKSFETTTAFNEQHVLQAIGAAFSTPELIAAINKALAPFHSPRLDNEPNYDENLDVENPGRSNTKRKQASWENFDLSDTLRPNAREIAEDLNNEKNNQKNDLKNQNKLKNKLTMTPDFENKLRQAAELVIKAQPKQRQEFTMKNTLRPTPY